MKPDLKFQFAADMVANTIRVKREFAAPRQMVWDCYTRADLLDRWFAPKPLTTATKHMDFRVGGYWHFAMIDPAGTEYWSRQDFLAITPIDAFSARDCFTDATGEPNTALPASRFDLSFSDVPAGTLVGTLVTYASADDLQKVIDMGMKEGLASTLDRLDELLATLI
ncbi:SRPBCC family protein [Seohaeicola zhoushanensis]|uniref:ATPase n=1 Tax=Seohaeicola zhoushanensis TaxID=1569283 RepID=A0A8J3H0F4_9RHOB|nr:SRPBCC domain-containing protein [Seohaeicola zhoushanensis]GHF62962.1 ATPase [Seohaeicola zhoushanensis]